MPARKIIFYVIKPFLEPQEEERTFAVSSNNSNNSNYSNNNNYKNYDNKNYKNYNS